MKFYIFFFHFTNCWTLYYVPYYGKSQDLVEVTSAKHDRMQLTFSEGSLSIGGVLWLQVRNRNTYYAIVFPVEGLNPEPYLREYRQKARWYFSESMSIIHFKNTIKTKNKKNARNKFGKVNSPTKYLLIQNIPYTKLIIVFSYKIYIIIVWMWLMLF